MGNPMLQHVPMKMPVPDHLQLAMFRMILQQGDHADGRNMVEVIKYFRQEMQAHYPGHICGLKEAKDYCDEIFRRMKNWVNRSLFPHEGG